MGGYVIFTWMSMVLTMTMAAYSLTAVDCDNDDSMTNAKSGLLAAIMVACVHSLSAWWIQRQILREMCKKLDKEYDQQGIELELRNYEVKDNVRGRIRAAIWEVVKYDIPFCIYFFIAPAAVGLGIWGVSILPRCTDEDNWAAAWAFGLLILYGCCTGLYFFFTLCGIACGAGREQVKQHAKQVKGQKRASPAPSPTLGTAAV